MQYAHWFLKDMAEEVNQVITAICEEQCMLSYKVSEGSLFWAPRSVEPRCEKTGLQGFRPDPTQTGLRNH